MLPGVNSFSNLLFAITILLCMEQSNRDEWPPCILEPQGSSKEYRKNWSRLIQKIYEVDPLTCPKCNSLLRFHTVSPWMWGLVSAKLLIPHAKHEFKQQRVISSLGCKSSPKRRLDVQTMNTEWIIEAKCRHKEGMALLYIFCFHTTENVSIWFSYIESPYMISNKRQSEVAIKLTNMWIHGVDSILDWRMKNRAAVRIQKIIYGVSIGGLPLQVAKTQQHRRFNTKLKGYQLKKRCFAPTCLSTAQRFSSSISNR
jgi:hypothetical protein